MTKEQVRGLLEFLGGSCKQRVSFDEKTVAAWFFMLCDEKPADVAAAVRHHLKVRGNRFAPNIPEIFSAMREVQKADSFGPEAAWDEQVERFRSKRSTNPSVPKDPIGIEAWKVWGGDERYSMLPDPRFSADERAATREISFAKQEFVRIYDRKKRDQQVQESARSMNALTDSEALKAFGLIEDHGGPIKRIFSRRIGK